MRFTLDNTEQYTGAMKKALHKGFTPHDGDGDGKYSLPGGKDVIPMPVRPPKKRKKTYYHGSATPLQVGDELLPPSETGVEFHSHPDIGDEFDNGSYVYLTDDPDQARNYAADSIHLGRGKESYVYEVEADDVEDDPESEYTGVTGAYRASRARIVRIVKSMTPHDGDGDGFVDDGKPTMRPVMPRLRLPKKHEPEIVHGRSQEQIEEAMKVEEGGKRYAYRVVSEADYQRMKTQGFLNSDGRGNVSADEGLVAAHGRTAWSYLSDIGGDKGHDNPSKTGRLLKIRIDDGDGWAVDPRDGYIKTGKPVPFDRVEMASMPIGVHRVVEVDGGSSTTSTHYDWSAAPLDLASHITAMPEYDGELPELPNGFANPRYWEWKKKAEAEYGSPVRGTPISPDDERIGKWVYHVTTGLRSIERDGKIVAGGKGGLGGDDRDRIVSLTVDGATAIEIAKDMLLIRDIAALHLEGDDLIQHLRREAERDGLEFTDRKWEEIGRYQDQGIAAVVNAYLFARDSAGGRRNPLFFGLAKLIERWRDDPPSQHDIGIIRLPSENLKTGAQLTDFDLGQGFLDEVRLYGDLPITGSDVLTGKPLKRGVGWGSPAFLRPIGWVKKRDIIRTALLHNFSKSTRGVIRAVRHAWHAADHPRHPAGSKDGGRFRSKSGEAVQLRLPLKLSGPDDPARHYESQRLSHSALAIRSWSKVQGWQFVGDEGDYWEHLQETMHNWTEMQKCKDIRKLAAQLVGLTAVAMDPLRDDPARWGGKFDFRTTEELLAATTSLMRSVHEGETFSVPLYRAADLNSDQIDELLSQISAGDLVDIPLLSFANTRRGLGFYKGGSDIEAGERPSVVIRVLPGAVGHRGEVLTHHFQPPSHFEEARQHRLRNYGRYDDDESDLITYILDYLQDDEATAKEIITGGRFRVRKITNVDGKVTITLEHVGTFDIDKGGVVVPVGVGKSEPAVVVSPALDRLFDSPMPTVKQPPKKSGK